MLVCCDVPTLNALDYIQVIAYLDQKRPKWPVPLTKGVKVKSAKKTKAPASGNNDASGSEHGTYFHGQLKKSKADGGEPA